MGYLTDGVCADGYEPEKPEPKYDHSAKLDPNLPITVGTQVRLTGVVRRVETANPKEPPYMDWVAVKIEGSWESPVGIATGNVEVIRQPFKRGEVVYFKGLDIPCVVVEDESENRVLLVEPTPDKRAAYVDADQYERRP